jgi:molecular chaperone DnaK (HSP70)
MIAVPITFDADPMSENELQQKLEKLRAEIEKVASNDTEARERMNALLGEVEKTLAASGEEVDENLLENIREAVSQFETDHPRATAILNDIMVTLSNMGI